MDQGEGSPAPYLQLDADGSVRAALQNAPSYIQVFYNLLKSSHDSNAASLAANSRVLSETTHTLNSLVSRVDELATRVDAVEQNQQGLGTPLDADIAGMREGISHNATANQEALNQRSLVDSREIIVRGIPPAVQLEPLQLASALLTALQLQQHVPLVVGWRAWNAPARADNAPQAVAVAPPEGAPAAQLRALVFTLACPATRDNILRRTPGLRNLDCQAIFGAGGGCKLSVNALSPDPIHKLLEYATTHSKQLSHLRPVVRNLTVFLRPSRNGPLIPITCEADVDALVRAKAHHNPTHDVHMQSPNTQTGA